MTKEQILEVCRPLGVNEASPHWSDFLEYMSKSVGPPVDPVITLEMVPALWIAFGHAWDEGYWYLAESNGLVADRKDPLK